MYSDADAAALYDVLNPWDPSDDFYLSHVMASASVLDVGCGTGTLLHRARENGHGGRLCGLDPDPAALGRARVRDDVAWVGGRAEDMTWDREFELAVMAGNAFQTLVSDSELRSSLAAIRRALVPGGRFVFGTRNPFARAWERWTPDNAADVVDHRGRSLRVSHRVESVEGDVVTFSETTATGEGEPLRVDRGRLRFLGPEGVDAFLRGAGLEAEERHGDWSRGPFTVGSTVIVTVARAVGG
ncbi:class I SAM-dependent methyltransferase [Nocardiopsis tropica]|uniref:class I SAM-dependent methyltransferase n=1 Tax=Nocardiopsis tropica TaxID=109330 RepID=UPI0031CDD975